MLVLSRRCEEKILFPTVGITLQILQIKPHQIKIGIEAPPSVTILREELEQARLPQQTTGRHAGESSPRTRRPSEDSLTSISLSLEALEQQCLLGKTDQAMKILSRLKQSIDSLRPSKERTVAREKCPALTDEDHEEHESWRAFWK